MWVLIRDQHVSARTRVYLAAEGALLSAHTCVCPAAGDALAVIKMGCFNHAIFFAFALIYAQFIHSGLGNKGGGVQLVCDCTYGLAWEVIFNGRKDRCVVRVSVFLTRVVVYVGMCVCIRTHTRPLHRWGTRCEPRCETDTWGAGRIQIY